MQDKTMTLEELALQMAGNNPVTEVADNEETLVQEAATTQEEEVKQEVTEEVDPSKVKVGNTGLTVEDLSKDPTTPAESLSNLDKFSQEYKKETEQILAEVAKEKELVHENTELTELIEKKKKENEFTDVIIEEKEEEEEDVAEKLGINLTSVKIKKPKDNAAAFNSLIKSKKKKALTVSVPLANSGYIAHMTGFSSPEIRDLSVALRTRDQFSYWDFLYQNIHEKMDSSSIGVMDYDTFLKSTALTELDILLYGIFSATYPESNEFPITCINPQCKMKFDYSYSNSDYLDIAEDDKSVAATAMRALIAGQTVDSKEFFENSNTNTLQRVILPSSKMIVELRHPTLYNQLYDVIKQLVDNDIEKASDVTLNRMPYIATILVPEDEEHPEEGYIAFDELMQKVKLLTDIDEKDDEALEEAISKNVLDKYVIDFKMKGISCPFCKKKIADQAVDFRQLLFMIHQIRSVSKK